MVKKILQKESALLRKISESVPVEDIPAPRIQNIIKDMKIALASQDDGVAIAAPQIGQPLRIFVISGKVQKIIKKESRSQPEDEDNSKTYKARAETDIVFINPKIKKISKEKKVVEEGCLSVRYLYGRVSRANKATVVAYDEYGNKFERGGTGLLSQIFQHEIDHLNGILFIDKAKDVEEIVPEYLKHISKRKNDKRHK